MYTFSTYLKNESVLCYYFILFDEKDRTPALYYYNMRVRSLMNWQADNIKYKIVNTYVLWQKTRPRENLFNTNTNTIAMDISANVNHDNL